VTESDDLRTFIRELMLRSDRRMEVVMARMDNGGTAPAG
jgi:hypothetical protein